MSLDLTLFLVAATAGVFAAAALWRLPLQRTWDWWLTLGLVGAVTATVAYLRPGAAGAAALAAFALLVALPWSLMRGAWRCAARGETARARARAAWGYRLHPLGEARTLGWMVDLVMRVEAGEDVDLESAVAATGLPAGMERALAAMVLVSWSGDFARVAPWLADPAVRREALRRGYGALVLAAEGETLGPSAVARAWPEVVANDRGLAASAHAGGVMLVAAAHLGAVDLCRALVRELARELPPARAAFWLATAEQRAGDVVSAHTTLQTAAAVPGLPRGGLRRLEHRMMHPVEPVASPVPPEVASLRTELSARVAARSALAGLGLASRRPSPVTWTLATVLALVFCAELVAGMGAGAGETLDRLGGLPVPLPSGVAALRVLTYGLVHASAWHLAVNLLTLVFFGRFVEQRIGGARMLALYVAAGAVGGLAALAGSPPGTLVVGASGSIFGLVGAVLGQILMDRALRSTPEGRRELTLLGVMLLVQGASDVLTPHTSAAAHVGGLVTGLVLGAALRRR